MLTRSNSVHELLTRSNSVYRLFTRSNSVYKLLTRSNSTLSSLAKSNLVSHSLERSNSVFSSLTRSNSVSRLQYNFSFAYKKLINTQLIHKKQISFNLISHLKQEAFSYILQVIQKEYSSKIKCWNSFLFKTSVVSQADQFNQSFIQLDIIKLKARSFNHAAHVKNIEVFSVILKKIDIFLNLELISSSSLNSDKSKSRHATLIICSKNSSTFAQFSSHSQDSMYDKNHHLNLHQMKKKFYLTAFMTQEDQERQFSHNSIV